MAFAKKFEVEVTVPKGKKAGDTFTVEVEAPELPKQARGQLNGIALVDMTDDQLKVELINSKSVLYKATKRGAEATTIAANQARVDAALAEKAKRTGKTEVTEVTEDPASEDAVIDGEPVDEETSAEI